MFSVLAIAKDTTHLQQLRAVAEEKDFQVLCVGETLTGKPCCVIRGSEGRNVLLTLSGAGAELEKLGNSDD